MSVQRPCDLYFACMMIIALQVTAAALPAQQGKPFDVSRISESDGMVVAVRPQKILAVESLKPITSMMGKQMEKEFGFHPDQIEQFVFHATDPNLPLGYQISIDLNTELNGVKYLQSLMRTDQIETVENRGKTYLKTPLPEWARQRMKNLQPKVEGQAEEDPKEVADGLCLWQPDKNSAFVGDEGAVKRLIGGERQHQNLLESKAWKQVNSQTVAIVFDKELLDRIMLQIRPENAPDEAIVLADALKTASIGVQVGETLTVVGYVYCQSPTHSRKALEAITTLVKMGEAALKMQIGAMEKGNSPEVDSMKMLAGMLAKTEITRDGNVVKLSSKISIDEFIDTTKEAVEASRTAAYRMQSANNGKQLGLAFHNFTDTYSKFPPAVGIGPKGHPYSWRVAMLPFMEQQALYDQYNFEEPWDSETNLKVLEQMPAAFRNPLDDDDSTTTSYQAFVGPDTLFWKEGAHFRDVTDGTSNTIMYIESKNATPWTKPEDIIYDPFDPEKLAPTLGGFYDGGFNAVFADGSVRFISNDVAEEKLHSMIQISDGGVIDD